MVPAGQGWGGTSPLQQFFQGVIVCHVTSPGGASWVTRARECASAACPLRRPLGGCAWEVGAGCFKKLGKVPVIAVRGFSTSKRPQCHSPRLPRCCGDLPWRSGRPGAWAQRGPPGVTPGFPPSRPQPVQLGRELRRQLRADELVPGALPDAAGEERHRKCGVLGGVRSQDPLSWCRLATDQLWTLGQ